MEKLHFLIIFLDTEAISIKPQSFFPPFKSGAYYALTPESNFRPVVISTHIRKNTVQNYKHILFVSILILFFYMHFDIKLRYFKNYRNYKNVKNVKENYYGYFLKGL